MTAALASFQMAAADEGRISLALTGDESAAIAREDRAGICALLYVAPGGAWREHTKFKGKGTTEEMLHAPLQSAGTIQEGVTRGDIKLLAERMCP
jgi:hypothetical protein